MGAADIEPDNDDDDEDCHQMVMAWTLEHWKVNILNCKLTFYANCSL